MSATTHIALLEIRQGIENCSRAAEELPSGNLCDILEKAMCEIDDAICDLYPLDEWIDEDEE